MENINNNEVLMSSIHDFGSNNNTTPGQSNTNPNQANSQIITSVGLANNNNDSDIDMGMLINYNELAKNNKFSEAFFRDKQIRQTVAILDTMKKPNALLVGGAGVGKTQIVEEIARRLVNGDPIVNHILKGYTIYELPVSNIVSGSSYVGQLEEKLEGVINFASNPKNKVILFIDEIHQIMVSSETSSYNKIAQILKPAMGRGNLTMIGATTTQEATTFMNDPAFKRRWSEVGVPELSIDETTEILKKIRLKFENHHNVLIPDSTLEQMVAIGDEFKQYGSHRPDSAITLMDRAMSDTKMKRLDLMEEAKSNPQLQIIINATPKPILTISQLKQSALTLLTGDDKLFKQNVIALKQSLDAKIIGQNKAKEEILDAVKRLSLGLTKRVRPTSFMFAGPSGTGKTEIAKQIANTMFGSQGRFIYINMSEYTSGASLNRITGAPAGYVGSDSKAELPFDSLEHNPYQLVLLDEFEKAHVDIQRFFMQALDEGVVKTNRNKNIDFSRCILVATTNAGVVELASNPIGFSESKEVPQRSSEDVTRILRASFDAELLNRFERLVAFTSIDKENYTKILAVKYNQLIEEIQANRKDLSFEPINIDIDDAVNNGTLKELTEKTYNAISNGRPAERSMREYIEDIILNNPNDTQFKLL